MTRTGTQTEIEGHRDWSLWKPIVLFGVLPIVLGACTFAPIPELDFDGYTTPDPVMLACDYLSEEFTEDDYVPKCEPDHDINQTGR